MISRKHEYFPTYLILIFSLIYIVYTFYILGVLVYLHISLEV